MSDRPRRILVVDDNPATLYATSRVLRASGFDVLTAATGGEAVSAAIASVPDLIVLDVNLPDFDGFEVVRRLRATPEVARIPIIHLSATFVQDVHKVQGLDGGANGYLTHPVEPPVLVATINAFLRTREAEDAMRRSEDRFKAIFDGAPDGIALLSRDLIFLDVNPALCRILGQPREMLVGKHVSALSPTDVQGEVEHVSSVVSEEGTWRGALPLLRSDGSRVDLEWSVSRHRDPDVRLAIISDVTERRRIESEREDLLGRERAARGEAERANRLKDDFLATLSHELRSPLNAIVGWTQVLQRRAGEASLPAEQLTNALSVIERNARLQTQLIADLLDVSSITSGKLRLEVVPLDPALPLEAAIEGVRPAAEAREIALELDIDHLAGPVLGDAARLQQVFWNLLSNAVKFTPSAGTVWAGIRRDHGHVEVTVRDTGCGIHPDFLPFVFERFRQEHSSTERTHGGVGLGLAIVRHLVEMHGGSVSASSEGEGRGSKFTVILPISGVRPGRRPGAGEGEEGRPEKGRPAESEADLRGLRVLVVDDDADSRDLLGRVLSDEGAEIHSAANAAQALVLAERVAPRVVVSDISMPGTDGYALIRELRRRNREGAELYAIAVTAQARDVDRQRGLAAGYDDFLVKPIDLDVLVGMLDAIARGRSTNGSSKPAAPSAR